MTTSSHCLVRDRVRLIGLENPCTVNEEETVEKKTQKELFQCQACVKSRPRLRKVGLDRCSYQRYIAVIRSLLPALNEEAVQATEVRDQ